MLNGLVSSAVNKLIKFALNTSKSTISFQFMVRANFELVVKYLFNYHIYAVSVFL